METNFRGVEVVDEHATMINYVIPAASISKLSAAFRLIEDNKTELCECLYSCLFITVELQVCIIAIIDYALSQSTLEQVFLKQIRPSGQEETGKASGSSSSNAIKVPHRCDYINGYLIWMLAGVIPGLHQFYLGDTWRGLKYFFTLNEFVVGWLLDLFDACVDSEASAAVWQCQGLLLALLSLVLPGVQSQ